MSLFEFTDKLPRTEKLYHLHPSRFEGTAHVIAIKENKVILDQTIFYPEGGGQVCDLGMINGVTVTAVSKFGGKPVKVEREGLESLWVPNGTIVVHQLEKKLEINPGSVVEMQIDGARRATCSINHSAAHFLYAAIREFLHDKGEDDIYTKGCSIGVQGFRFDLGNSVSGEDLFQIDQIMKSMLSGTRNIFMEPMDECDDVFLWKSGDLTIPCGGTHVLDTTQIGPILLRRRSKGKNSIRIEGIVSGVF